MTAFPELMVVLSSLMAVGVLVIAWAASVLRVGTLGERWRMPRLTVAAPLPGAPPLRAWPVALSITVDEAGGGALAGAGRLAARALFPASRFPPFSLRVLHAGPRPQGLLGRRGAWADPGSPLANLHFGILEIDAEAARWRCPFGFRPGGGVDGETLARLVKADWNYFAAYLYGVPLDAVGACDPLEGTAAAVELPGFELGGRRWQVLELPWLQVASALLGRGEPRRLSPGQPLLRAAFRFGFGVAAPGEAERSFAPTALRVRLQLSHGEWRDADRGPMYRTTVLLAAARADAPGAEALLDAESEALRAVAPRLIDRRRAP